MAASRQEKEIMRNAAEDGDALAARAMADAHEEDGLPLMPRFERGQWVVIYTGAFFHCGQLLGEDHEYYGLAAGSAQIFATGPFKDFYGKGVCTECETIPESVLIRKGPTTHLSLWPFTRPCRTAEGRA